MKKTFLLFTVLLSISAFSQLPLAKIKEITKKFIIIDAKSEGSIINVRYDSIIVKQETMKEAIMSYLKGSMLKMEEYQKKQEDFQKTIIGSPSEAELNRNKMYLFAISKISEKQRVLLFEKLPKADNTKKIITHSRSIYYLKLDDDVTDGNYQSDYYFTIKGIPIDNIYEYFLEHIN